jgi:hypothetical protein
MKVRVAHGAGILQAESQVCSNQIWTSATTTWSSAPKRIAGKSIRRSQWSQQHGRQAANSIGGSKNGRNGGVAYAVLPAVNGASELLIFVP